MTLGEKIKHRRLELNMSQDELAKKVGYAGRSAICKLENDERDANKKMIEKLSEALLVEPTYFFNFENGTALIRDSLFEKKKILFSMSEKASEEDLDKIITIVKTIVGEGGEEADE